MRHEVQAYAEAVRRMELIGEELTQAMQENRSPKRLKSRFPSVFTSSGTVTGSFMSNDSSDDGDAVEGAIPDISEKYILNSLQVSKGLMRPCSPNIRPYSLAPSARLIGFCLL